MINDLIDFNSAQMNINNCLYNLHNKLRNQHDCDISNTDDDNADSSKCCGYCAIDSDSDRQEKDN